MFQLKKELIADQEIITIIHPEGKSSFSTISSLGASLFKLRLTDQESSQDIFKHWDNPSTLVEDYYQRYPGAQLFPFPNRLAKGTYNLDGKTYHFPLNDLGRSNSLHGHLHHRSFYLDEWNPEKGKLTLVHDSKGKDPAFPFSYKIKNHFTLSGNALHVATEISNTSEQEFPFGYGWHPYFQTPSTADNYSIQIPSIAQIKVDDALIPTGKLEPFDNFKIESKISDRPFDTCLKLAKNAKVIRLIDPEKKHCISLDISHFDYLQIYIPPERDAIALEPQSCAPDAFNNGMGLSFLKAHKTTTFTFKISLEGRTS